MSHPHGDLKTYRKVKGLLGPVEVDRPAWADYAIGESITFESPAGVLSAPVIGYSIRDEYRGLPAVWMPDELYEHFEDPGGVLVIAEEYHVPEADTE